MGVGPNKPLQQTPTHDGSPQLKTLWGAALLSFVVSPLQEHVTRALRSLAELGLIDEYEFVVHPRLAGHGPTLFAGLSKCVDLRLVSRLEFGSGAVAMRYAPRR